MFSCIRDLYRRIKGQTTDTATSPLLLPSYDTPVPAKVSESAVKYVQYCETWYWTTKSRQRIRLDRLDDAHLTNIIAMMQRNKNKAYRPCSSPIYFALLKERERRDGDPLFSGNLDPLT